MDYFTDEFNSINSKFTQYLEENSNLKTENSNLKHENISLLNKIDKLNQDYENYNKVSVVKNLHNQIYEKDILITILENKIKNNKIKKMNNNYLTLHLSGLF